MASTIARVGLLRRRSANCRQARSGTGSTLKLALALNSLRFSGVGSAKVRAVRSETPVGSASPADARSTSFPTP